MVRRKGSDTKERIINVSLECLLEHGYHATSMRDIAEKVEMAPGGLYNHFKEKDEIFVAVLNQYHPWLLIPGIVRSASGNDFDQFIYDASAKAQKAIKKNKKLIKLHFIELVEFNGVHLADLFERAFTAMLAVLNEKKQTAPHILKERSIPQLSRTLLGLFFSYMINDRSVLGSTHISDQQVQFDYLNDVYLQGVIAQFEDPLKLTPKR